MLTNELVALRTDFIKIPDEIKGVKLEDAKKQILMEGKPLKLEGMISTKGTEFLAMDDVFRNMPDLKEEEEEWNRYGISGGDDSLAQGVTYDEPSSEMAITIVQRLQGAELFSLLENSIKGASRKIAELLDSTLSSETEASSSTLMNNDLSDFDIV
eukprot:gene18826-22421_t